MIDDVVCLWYTLQGNALITRFEVASTLPWRHNDQDCNSNHQPRGCLLNRLFRRKSKKISKLRVTGFVWGIHRDRWIPRTKGQLRGKCFHLMTSSWDMLVLQGYLLLVLLVLRLEYDKCIPYKYIHVPYQVHTNLVNMKITICFNYTLNYRHVGRQPWRSYISDRWHGG